MPSEGVSARLCAFGNMRIGSITLKNFRNYEEALICPCEGVTVLAGDNAQGKTNVLEAVYLCCTGRSHRTSHDREMIRAGQESCYVKVSGLRRDGPHDVEIAFSDAGKRRVKVNGSVIARSGELLGHITGVLFAPEDLRMIKDGPAARRRFMDMELSQLKPAYYYALQRYNRALKQRGALLREMNLQASPGDTLELWDAELSQSGAEIMRARQSFLTRLTESARDIHGRVSGGREDLDIRYEPDVPDAPTADEAALAILEALRQQRAQDVKRMLTSRGPHRDDIGVYVDGMDARAFGSQGQVRTCALSLKLSEIELMRQETGEAPVLMLDDVMSELDPERRRLLVSSFSDVQTLITCTDPGDLAGAKPGKLLRVSAAKITEA